MLPNFPTESMAQIERPQSARDAPCHIPMVTKTGSALRLALAGGHHRVTAVISKAKVVGGQSSVVLRNHHREARKTARAPNFFVNKLAWVSGDCTRRPLPAMLLVFCLRSPCCGSRNRRDWRPLHKTLFLTTVVFVNAASSCA